MADIIQNVLYKHTNKSSYIVGQIIMKVSVLFQVCFCSYVLRIGLTSNYAFNLLAIALIKGIHSLQALIMSG